MINKGWPIRSFALFAIIVIGVVSCFPHNIYADGKYFPEKAYKAAPAIPSQRAILVYKDGFEKLTIESSLDGKGHEFGWIIPLPSVPTEFKKVSPGLIQTFSLTVQPKIIHDHKEELAALWRVTLFIGLFCLIGAMIKPPYRVVGMVVLFFFLVILFMPHLGRRMTLGISMAEKPGITVHDVQQIGSYGLVVLEADTSDALDRWLQDSGYAALTKEDKAIVSDYIKEQWCFVAAKLHREKEGVSKPHPLSMFFTTDTPIYPVRLTGTTGNNVYLELFVVAGKRASCELLTLEVSDTYHLEQSRIQRVYGDDPLPGFVGNAYRQAIGHPDAREQMWDGCILSKLSGTLTPNHMSEDIVLQLKTNEPFQKLYYSRRGAGDKALAFCLISWCILPVILFWLFVRVGEKVRKIVFFRRFVVPALLLSILIYGVTYAVLPKTNVISVGGKKLPHQVSDYLERIYRAIDVQMLAEEHGNFVGMSKDEIAKLLSEYLISKDTVNIFTGEPIKEEDSPGNYTLFEDDRGIVWRTYSMEGYPDDCVLVPTQQD